MSEAPKTTNRTFALGPEEEKLIGKIAMHLRKTAGIKASRADSIRFALREAVKGLPK